MPLILTLIAGGFFLVGAAFIPWLVQERVGVLNGSGDIRPPIIMNQAAPEISLEDIDGNPVSLDDLSGKTVLINNWATWCPPCKAEMPDLQSYYESHAEEGFIVIAIESGDAAPIVSNFVRQFHLTFPVWLDPQVAVLDLFENWSLPSSYFIDREGILRMSWTGPVNLATLEKYISPLLRK
jgi:thiol-disulfide isomerase/thioredoxin